MYNKIVVDQIGGKKWRDEIREKEKVKKENIFVGDILTAIMYDKNSKSYLKGMKRTSHDVHTKPTILV